MTCRRHPLNLNASEKSERNERPSRIAFRFSLFALFLFVTVVCGLLAWWVQPKRYVVETIFQIDATPPAMVMEARPPFDAEAFRLLRTTHSQLIKSEMVLLSALRDPQIGALPMFRSHPEPVAWLRDQIEVEVPNSSELLIIRMRCVEGATDDVRHVVDAVGAAYLKEVIWDAEQRQIVTRDAVSHAVSELRKRLVALSDAGREREDGGNDPVPTSQTSRIEIEAVREVLLKCMIELEILNVNAMAPDRVRFIQKAVSRPE